MHLLHNPLYLDKLVVARLRACRKVKWLGEPDLETKQRMSENTFDREMDTMVVLK